MSTPRSGLPSSGRATLPMQTDVWMFRAQTMKMAGRCFDPMHRNRPLRDAPRKIRRPVGKHTTTMHGRCLGQRHAKCRMRCLTCTDIWMFRAQTMKMAGGDSTPCIRTDLWGDAPPQNQTACGRANSHMQGLCLGQRHAQCREM